MALNRTESGWLLQNMVADVALLEAKRPSWTEYNYGEVAFVNQVVTGEQFSKWLSDLRGEAQGYSFQIPQPQQRIRYERYTSHTDLRQLYRVRYPFTLYPVSPTNYDQGERRDNFTPLVKEGLPSFRNYRTALFRFLYDLDDQRGSDISRDLIAIRVVHPEAWIEDVVVESEAVTVTVSGTQVKGARLTVGGSSGVLVNEVLDQGGAYKYKISSVGSDNLWLVLSRGDRWLDSREVYAHRVSISWDVTGIQPGNLAAHIQELLLQGENERLEYKARVPDKEEKFLKTVVAFANGAGGIILIGVTDDGKVEGIKEDISRYMDGIANSIRNKLVPQPIFHLERCEVDHKQVVGVFIKEGDDTPYSINTKPPSIYVRRAGTTFDATQAEIKALGLKNQPQHDYYGGLYQ
jgi:Putative DNA-binding domain